MWAGVQRVDTYNVHLDSGNFRLRLSVIGCVTPDVFDAKSAFRRLGFLSRLIPFSFNCNHNTIDEILKFIGTLEEDKLRIETTKISSRKKLKSTFHRFT
jgi:hypothetical protein